MVIVLCFGFRMKTVLIAHQCVSCCRAELHRAEDVSAPGAALPARTWGCTRENRTGIADVSWPKVCPKLCGVMLNDKTEGGVGWEGCCCLGTGWASVNGWWAIILCIIYFVNIYYYFPIISCPTKLSLSQPTSSSVFPTLSPAYWGKRVQCSAACWVKAQQLGDAQIFLVDLWMKSTKDVCSFCITSLLWHYLIEMHNSNI